MSSTHRHLLLDFFWQVISGPPCIVPQYYIIYFQNLLKKWNLSGKVQTIVTDNASVMIRVCDLLKINHLNCFAHTLNLTVNDGLEDATNPDLIIMLEKCKSIVKH
jgi:hypothetical protein